MKKLKLILVAFALLVGGVFSASAQTDVTSTYITNAGFESCTALTTNQGTGSNVNYSGEGWTASDNADWCCGAVVAYGGTGQVNGASAPSADNEGNEGNALGISVGWGGTITYKTANVTLPAGYYILSVNAYNNNSDAAQFTSKVGFVTSSNSYLSSSPSYPYSSWVKDEVAFYLSTATEGYFQIGGTAVGGGSGSNAKVFFDNVTLTYSEKQMDYTSSVGKETTWLKGDGTASGTTTGNGVALREYYASATSGTKLYQNVTGLTNGIYKVVLYATSHNARGEGDATLNGTRDDVAYVFATSGDETKKTYITASGVTPGFLMTEPIQAVISDVEVKDGTLQLGLGLDEANITGWHTIQIKSLTRTANLDLSTLIAAYNSAKTAAEAFTEASMFASDWTTLQTAITSNTLDVDDPELTESALSTATENLLAANTTATAAVASKTTYDTANTTINGGTNVSLTSLITNPSFESDFTGWTNVGMAAQGNTSFGKTGSKYAECWQPDGTKSVSQTVGALPAGIYTIQLRAKARGVTSAKLFANSNEQAIAIEDNENEYSMTFEIADKASINICFEGVGTGAGSSWLAFDNFRLTYVGTIDDLAYTKATGKMGTDKSAAQDAAEATFLANKTLANYNALVAAIAEAEASVANYATLKTAIDKANDVIDANNFVTAAATTALQSEITTATNGWTDITFTDAEAVAEINALGSAVSAWHAIDHNGKAGAFMASTWGKNSENWWTNFYINTWSVEGDNDGTGFSVPFFEYYTGDKENLGANTFTATLSGLDNGCYEVELWARAQRRSDADFNADNSMITMSVNGGDATSIMSGQTTVGEGGNTMRLGRYTARGMVTDGTLTLSIDVVLGSNVHWLCWRDVTYTKVSDATVSATIGDTGWATFASTSALDLSNMETTEGTVTAYYASAVGDGTVTMTSTDQAAVKAGEGIMLKGTAGAEITIPVVASGSAISGNKLVGCTSNQTITNETANYGSIYVLGIKDGTTNVAEFQNLKNYIEGGNTVEIPAGKAYLNASIASSARSLRIVFAGDITGINEAAQAAEAAQKDGKFFKNGKLFIMKNGVKFNANGQQVK